LSALLLDNGFIPNGGGPVIVPGFFLNIIHKSLFLNANYRITE